MSSFLCCCCQQGSDDDSYKTPRMDISNGNSTGHHHHIQNYSAINGDPASATSPPLLEHCSSSVHNASSSVYTPSSPRVVRGRHSNSANEYVSHVVNLCQIGSGSFAVVSLVIDKNLLATLKDSESALPAYFAVKRISKRHEASRLAPGEGGAHAERHTHAMLEHPFFPVLYNASRSSRDFYIAFPFALGADVSKALARRANCIRGFGKDQAAQIHAQAQVGGTLHGMRDLIGATTSSTCTTNNNNQKPNSLGRTQQNSLNNNLIASCSSSKMMTKKSRSGSENNNANNNNTNNNENTSSSSTSSAKNSFPKTNHSHNSNNSRKSSPRSDKSSPRTSQQQFASSSTAAAASTIPKNSFSEVRATEYGLPISFVCVVAFELLSAIAFLNEKGYTHYDIRPGNLLLVHGGHVILGDFGMIRDESPNKNNNDPMNSGENGGDSRDHSAFSKFFNALMGKSANNDSYGGPSTSQNASFGYNNNASFGGNNSSFYHHGKNNNGTSPGKGNNNNNNNVSETSNEKRSQLYLAPEHLSSATNSEAENDCKRLSDVWSYGVLLMELALGAHPFTPQNGQDSSAFAMLTSIKKMIWRRVPTNTIENELVANCVDLLNDLCGAIFVPRDRRPSASSLMNHPFFASSQVRALVGITDETQGANLNNPQFFGRVVNKKKLVGPASLDPGQVCRRGGCPTAKELREWLSVLAPCPQHIAPEDFAPTLEMEVFDDDDNEDSRDLVDLRFFGSLSDDDLSRWNRDDNDNCLRMYDSEWCPGDMACTRAGVFSSHHASGLGGGNNNAAVAVANPDYDVVMASDDHNQQAGNNNNGGGGGGGKKSNHQRQKSGGGIYYNHGGEVDQYYGGMNERPGFTFVRPSAAMLNGQHVY